MSRYYGIGTALVTPFRGGEVDYDGYKGLLDRQIKAGIDFIVALGTTAETPCLEHEEKMKLLETTRKAYDGRLMIGVGTNSLRATVNNIKAFDVFDPDSWLVVVPYYNRPSQAGLYEYFRALASETRRNIIIYNVPVRTGTTIMPETLARLAEIPNITGIKEASDNVPFSLSVKEAVGDDFICLSGSDAHWLDLSKEGYQGLISVASNIAPEDMKVLGDAIEKGDFKAADSLNNRLKPLYSACFIDGNPASVKAGLHLLDLCENSLRLPLTTASTEATELMRAELKRLHML